MLGKLYSRLQTENELTISRIRIYLLIPQQPQRTLTFPLRAGRESASKGRKKKHITGRRMERLIFFSLAAPVVVLGCGGGGVFYRKIINRYFPQKAAGPPRGSPQPFSSGAPSGGAPARRPPAARARAGADSEQKLRPNFAKLSETLPPPPPSSPRPSPPAPPAAAALRGAPLSAEGMAAVPPSAAPPPRPLSAEVRGAPGGRPPPLRQSFGIGVSS